MNRVETRQHERPIALQVVTLVATFVGGLALGNFLPQWLVPGSETAIIITFLLPPLAMILGLQSWLGLAILAAVVRLIGAAVRRGFPPERRVGSGNAAVVPPGSFVFVPISTAILGFGGIFCGILPASEGFFAVVAGYLMAGASYGTLLWIVAREGYLPLPDDF